MRGEERSLMNFGGGGGGGGFPDFQFFVCCQFTAVVKDSQHTLESNIG